MESPLSIRFNTGGSFGTSLFPPEVGFIGKDGKYFRTEKGEIWQWRGATQFILPYLFEVGRNIDANLNWMRRWGFNVARVFPQFTDNFPSFYYPNPVQLIRFARYLQKFGLRTELTLITNPDDEEWQKFWVQDCYHKLRAEWNVFIEIYNEPEMHGYGDRHFTDGMNRYDLVSSYGYYVLDDIENPPGYHNFKMPAQLEYVTVHSSRDDEWPRKAKDILEYRDGFSDDGGNFPGCNAPCVNDEGMGAAEYDQPGRRSSVGNDFESYFGITAFFSSGGTYHFENGILGHIPAPGSKQQQIAEQISEVWKFVPRDLQLGTYEHPRELEDPIGALRVYKNGNYYVAVRPTKGSLKDVLPVKSSTKSGLIVST